ncbi:MAG: TetR/AcrR family transcriptional regulator, cholesterol catabolism regulator [Actinomycetota bacterium]|jgi:AcrR family transcriptional regulator|nr:TetR/AcrR family transcriptional regulator, cholesterol catabolism regulator [Actinomycetota bacterium]
MVGSAGRDGLIARATERPRSPATERVQRAGLDLFSEVGFLATTIRDITGSCGITAAAFYNHFESKESLLYALVDEANTRLESHFEDLDLTGVPVGAALDSLVRALVVFNLTSPKEARVANREYGFLQGPLRDEVVEHRRHVRSLFEDVLARREVPRGLLAGTAVDADADTEPRLLAISIINLSIASSEWYRPGGRLSVDEVAETYCRLARRMAGLDGSPTGAKSPSTRRRR